jgi:predicted alpha/beta hydrolase
MQSGVERRRLTLRARDGANASLQLHLPARPHAAVYWLPALGVGIGPNESFADALAASGVAVAVHEWRGLGDSDRRASRHCDWGYRELLDLDIASGIETARNAIDVPRWYLGGHSLGGQMALIEAARRGNQFAGTLLVASGQPYWRAFGGLRALGVYAFAAAIPLLTAIAGYFPGARLGFAGREAGELMREWSRTLRRGDYRLPQFADALDHALHAHVGRVLAVRMTEDRLAPRGAIRRLRELTPNARWTELEFGREHIKARRPDHFGWLRDPHPVRDAFLQWEADSVASAESIEKVPSAH